MTGRHPSGALSKTGKAKAKAKAGPAREQEQQQSAPFKGRGRGGGKGNPNPKAKAKAKAKSAKDKKKTLCKFVKKGETCPAGNNCEYNHKHWLFDANGKWVGKPAGKGRGRGGGRGGRRGGRRSGGLEEDEYYGDDDDGWGAPENPTAGLRVVRGRSPLCEPYDSPTYGLCETGMQPCEPSLEPAAGAACSHSLRASPQFLLVRMTKEEVKYLSLIHI